MTGVDLLVSSGYPLVEVRKMSIRTIQMLVDFADARNKRNLSSLTVCVRQAQGTDQKVLQHFLDSLENPDAH